MRILFLSGLYPPNTKGGGELSTHFIAQALRERGHDVLVITSSAQGRTEEVVTGVPVVRIPVSFTAKPLFERSWARRMARHLQAELARHQHFDIVHCHDFRMAQVVSGMDLPHAVVTVRDYAFICGSPNNILADGSLCPGCERITNVVKNRSVVEAPLLRKPFRIWQYWYNIEFRKQTLASFEHQIYISRAQREIIAERTKASVPHQEVIYNPIPPKYVSVIPVRSVAKTILYVGTVESYKGVGMLLEAFQKLAPKYHDIQLKIVGDGKQRQQYEEQVARRGLQYRVTFAGSVAHERMRGLYDEAWLVVAPHIWPEPFGRTTVEAMVRERVVVAARAGGPGEILADGKTGLLFERGSLASLIETLEEAFNLSEIERREMQRSARVWACSNLDASRIAEQYEKFYGEMLSTINA